MKEKIINFSRLFGPLILGSIVGFLIKDSLDYENLLKPPLSLPGIIFPIIWSILYLLMGISYFLYRRQNQALKTIILYYLQLGLNLSWTFIFFVFKFRFLAIFWIVLLIINVFLLIKKNKVFYLLIPYLIWLLFALYLNIGVYLLN